MPKCIDISSDANKAVLESMGGTILSESKLVYARVIIQGVQNKALTSIDINRDVVEDIAVKYGYPSGNRTTGIANATELGDDWAYGDTLGGRLFLLNSLLFCWVQRYY